MASALTGYRTLPKPLAEAVDRIAEQVVAQWADAYPNVRRRRCLWTRNLKAKLSASLARELEDDLIEALKSQL
jgi:hypothetical protein